MSRSKIRESGLSVPDITRVAKFEYEGQHVLNVTLNVGGAYLSVWEMDQLEKTIAGIVADKFINEKRRLEYLEQENRKDQDKLKKELNILRVNHRAYSSEVAEKESKLSKLNQQIEEAYRRLEKLSDHYMDMVERYIKYEPPVINDEEMIIWEEEDIVPQLDTLEE